MEFLVFALIAVSFLGIGILIGRVCSRFDGLFLVDDSDEETTRWTLDVRIDPKTIPNKKEIRLQVKKMTEGDV